MNTLKLVVTAIEDTIDGIRTLSLADPDGNPLPSFTPGSHIVVECGGKANAFRQSSRSAAAG